LAPSSRERLGPVGTDRIAQDEYETAFGARHVNTWPLTPVLDGLDLLTALLDTDEIRVHPRCVHLREAMKNHARKRVRGQIAS
jgi:hypothetical protein